jgi:hypothetical protein
MRETTGRVGLILTLALGLFAIAATSGCGGDDGLMTKGTYCSRIGGPVCDRAIACGLGPASDRSSCLSSFQAGCCGDDGSCGQRATDSSQQMLLEQIVSDCSAAVSTFDCTELANGDAPVECGGTAPSGPSSTPSSPVPTPVSLDAVRSTGHLMGQHASVGTP